MTAAGNKKTMRMYWESTVGDQELPQVWLIWVGFLHRGWPCFEKCGFLRNFSVVENNRDRHVMMHSWHHFPWLRHFVNHATHVLNTLWWKYTFFSPLFFYSILEPALVEGVTSLGKRVGTRWSFKVLPIPNCSVILWFYSHFATMQTFSIHSLV